MFCIILDEIIEINHRYVRILGPFKTLEETRDYAEEHLAPKGLTGGIDSIEMPVPNPVFPED